MSEFITEQLPQIKYDLIRTGAFHVVSYDNELQQLTHMMHVMETLGAAPVLVDRKVGGNCGVLRSHVDRQVSTTLHDAEGT